MLRSRASRCWLLGCFWLLAAGFLANPLVGEEKKNDPVSPKSRAPVKLTDEALRIHRAALVIDGHNDLPWQFRDKGRMAPEGLRYVMSWVTQDLGACYQVMETDDRALLDQWIGQWTDLVEFEVISVVTSAQASAAVT